jgi:sulfite reductase alpha subunit-like flavoprotein
MYAVGGQFNRAAKRLSSRMEEVGGTRMIDVGLGDDQASELYRGELTKWLDKLLPVLFGKEGGGTSLLDPPEPLFTVSKAPGSHRSSFRPLPPGYHFVRLRSTDSLVAAAYDRPASIFTFDLQDTGVQYEVGDHLAVLPRNPDETVKQLLSLYSENISGSDLLTVDAVDRHSDSPFPPVLSVQELLAQYLDICGRPSRGFFKQLLLFASSLESRNRLRMLVDRENDPKELEESGIFERYTAIHTFADVLWEFRETALPPFEYLLSMIPPICPRLYSIASSPLYQKDSLDLLIVLNTWEDPSQKYRVGLCTRYLFGIDMGEKVAIQVRKGILQPPADPGTPIVMFGLGTGVAPFRAFMQHRQALLALGETLGKATLYVGYRHETKDYYLKESFRKWVQEGVLTAIHPAFSHDNLEKRGGKLYFITDLIEEKPNDLARAVLMEKDAIHCYYCGPAQNVPQGIQEAMKKAVQDEKGGGMPQREAESLMERMIRLEDRFHIECF